MTKKTDSKELATIGIEDYAIMKSDPQKIAELLLENLDGDEISENDLERIKWPSSDTPAFARHTESGTEMLTELEGVVIYAGTRRGYWNQAYGEGVAGSPPDCSSFDGRIGSGHLPGEPKNSDNNPIIRTGRICKSCPMSKFGSAKDAAGKPAKGQACQQRKLLMMAFPDSVLPVAVSLPPTSLGAWKDYVMMLTTKSISLRGVVTKISLTIEPNAAGVKYAKANLSCGDTLNEEQALGLMKMGETLKAVFSSVGFESEDDVPQGATVHGEVVDP